MYSANTYIPNLSFRQSDGVAFPDDWRAKRALAHQSSENRTPDLYFGWAPNFQRQVDVIALVSLIGIDSKLPADMLSTSTQVSTFVGDWWKV